MLTLDVDEVIRLDRLEFKQGARSFGVVSDLSDLQKKYNKPLDIPRLSIGKLADANAEGMDRGAIFASFEINGFKTRGRQLRKV